MRRDDSELVAKAKAGDGKAYDELIKLYKDAVYSIIYRMVHNKQEAEDLSQEAFIKAYNSINSFNEDYSFSTWLFKIATNNCIDFFRKRKLKIYSMDQTIKYKDDEKNKIKKISVINQFGDKLEELIRELDKRNPNIKHDDIKYLKPWF